MLPTDTRVYAIPNPDYYAGGFPLSEIDPTRNLAGLRLTASPGRLFHNVLLLVMIVAALLTLFQLLAGALKWITSGGDKGKVEEARDRIAAAIIGLLIVAATWAIFRLTVQAAFGIDTDELWIPFLAM